ncbi:MAG: hypothetical protein R6U37_00555 [Dehalococcoidia bacterium]
MDPMGDLRELIVGGLVENIRQVEESRVLWQEISAHAEAINEAGFGNMFGRLQPILARYTVLATCRLYEPESDKYPLKSIPATLNHIRYNADYLQIQNKEFIIEKLISFGHDRSEFEGIPDPWINQLVRKEFADRLPGQNAPEENEISGALHHLKTVRDEFSEHSESVQRLDGARDASMNLLLAFAEDFVGTIGKGYLDIDYVFGDGDSIFRIDAERTTSTLQQLLRAAGIQD